MKFSTNPNPEKRKTKCIFVRGLSKREDKPANLYLDGKELTWVESAAHLGHIIHETGNMEKDIRVKRAVFIDESTTIREVFSFASPV